jgi:hypothetical protein
MEFFPRDAVARSPGSGQRLPFEDLQGLKGYTEIQM